MKASTNDNKSAKLAKVARSRGKRDGKSEKPGPNWGRNSVPFLVELQKLSAERAKHLELQTRQNLSTSVKKTLARDEKLAILKNQINGYQEKISQLADRAKRIQKSIDGYEEENPIGRFARVRAIPDLVYWAILVVLATGEVLVTAPALVQLFNELEQIAYVIAFAAGLLTVVFAHIVGISLKMKLDRQKPQENWVIKTLIPLAIVVLIAVIGLALLRSGQVFGQLASFNILTSDLAKRIFLILFFIFLQLSFIGIAAKLAFLHFSQQEHELRKAKRDLKIQEKKRDKLTSAFAKLAAQNFLSRDLIDVAKREMESKIALIASNYDAAAAIYCDANIHARRDEIDASHPALIPPPFLHSPDGLQDLSDLALEYGNREIPKI